MGEGGVSATEESLTVVEPLTEVGRGMMETERERDTTKLVYMDGIHLVKCGASKILPAAIFIIYAKNEKGGNHEYRVIQNSCHKLQSLNEQAVCSIQCIG